MRLQTPTLDKERAEILDQISSEGGYAFIRMITTASQGDARAAEEAREMAWEQLHSGPWHSVLTAWRDAYAMACLHVANCHLEEGECLKVLDMGLIMGGDLLRPDLLSVVLEREKRGNISAGRCSNKVLYSSDEFNQDEATNILPVKSLSSKLVAKCSGLSIEGFLRDYFIAGMPVVISDSMSHWSARSRWNSVEYLNTIAGDRTVPVECFQTVAQLGELQSWKFSG